MTDSELEPVPKSTFAARADALRKAAREAATEEVQAIRQRGTTALERLRGAHALELAALEGVAKGKRARATRAKVVLGLLGTSVLAAAAGGLAFETPKHSSDHDWSELRAWHRDFNATVVISEANAVREIAVRQATHRGRPVERPRAESPRACADDPFDPMSDCY
jgi:hypothetical protein